MLVNCWLVLTGVVGDVMLAATEVPTPNLPLV